MQCYQTIEQQVKNIIYSDQSPEKILGICRALPSTCVTWVRGVVAMSIVGGL